MVICLLRRHKFFCVCNQVSVSFCLITLSSWNLLDTFEQICTWIICFSLCLRTTKSRSHIDHKQSTRWIHHHRSGNRCWGKICRLVRDRYCIQRRVDKTLLLWCAFAKVWINIIYSLILQLVLRWYNKWWSNRLPFWPAGIEFASLHWERHSQGHSWFGLVPKLVSTLHPM